MMRVLFLFLDGLGLGADDPAVNPLARAGMPHLRALLGGRALTASAAPFDGPRASLRAIDAALGVPGLPQSATGQAVLLTGVNLPAAIGEHYGPKPDKRVAAYLQDTLFARVTAAGGGAALLNAYPERYFHGVNSGRRLYSSIPLAVVNAGIALFGQDDLYAGRALSADFTGQGWRDRLGMLDAPVLTPGEAGAKMAELAGKYAFSMFEYWPSDYAGHGQEMDPALGLLDSFDGVLGGLLETWDDRQGLIVLTSDHGNLEDLSTRKHTLNPVPALVIGDPAARARFLDGLRDLTGIAPAILQTITQQNK